MIPQNLQKAGGSEILMDLWAEKVDEDCGRGRKGCFPTRAAQCSLQGWHEPLANTPLLHVGLSVSGSPEAPVLQLCLGWVPVQ